MILIVPLSGCITGQEDVATVTTPHDISGFDSIIINAPYDVTVKRGDSFSVDVTVDENSIQRVIVTEYEGTLYLDAKDKKILEKNFSTLEAKITLPDVRMLSASGASSVSIKGFDLGHDIVLFVSGASDVSGSLTSIRCMTTISGASDVSLSGGCEMLSLTVSGASDALLLGFEAYDVDVNVSGASYAAVTAKGSIRGSVDGASSLHYAGFPILGDMVVTGASEVTKEK